MGRHGQRGAELRVLCSGGRGSFYTIGSGTLGCGEDVLVAMEAARTGSAGLVAWIGLLYTCTERSEKGDKALTLSFALLASVVTSHRCTPRRCFGTGHESLEWGAMAAVATTRALIAPALASSASRSAAPSSFLGGNALVSVPPRAAALANAKVGVRCQASEKDEVTVTRRDVFVGLSAAVVAAGVWTSTPGGQEAHAADIIQRQQRGIFLNSVKEKLRVEIAANPDIIPDLLRLALNDALTYDKETKTGGANGSTRLELNRPENKGLEKAISFLEPIKQSIDEAAVTKGGPISWADLIHIAAQSAVKRTFIQAAVRKCGGDQKKGENLYTAYGSTGQWGQFDKLLGRADASEADPEGRVLDWEIASTTEIKERFAKLSIKPRQIVVLSAFFGRDQAATEAKFAADPEFARWVKKYRESRETVSQTDYEVDLITIFTRLSVIGQSINYEAYSFKPKGSIRF